MSNKSLLRYHPERYRRTRPFAKRLVTDYRSIVGVNPPTAEYFEGVKNLIMKTYNDEISLIPRESRPTDTRRLMREPDFSIHYGAYCSYGRNIFHLEDEILEEFLHTDVDSVPIGLVDFPYESFYISFGSVKELTLYDGNFQVDGAYVSVFEGFPLQITLTTSIPDWNYSSRYEWIFNPDRYYFMAIERSNPLATFEELKKQSLKNELKAQTNDTEMLRDGIYEYDGKSFGIINKRPESSKKDKEEILAGFGTFETALNLVINSICYISQYREDIEESWPKGTPNSLLEKLNNSKTAKQKQRNNSKLISMGYSKIKVCGRNFKKEKSSNGSSEVRAHWRRGHWRVQAYGEALKLSKVIWIRPTVVRKDKGEPSVGHIYK